MNKLNLTLDFTKHNILLNPQKENVKITVKTTVKIVPLYPGWSRYKIIDDESGVTIYDCNGFGFKSIGTAKNFLSSHQNQNKFELVGIGSNPLF